MSNGQTDAFAIQCSLQMTFPTVTSQTIFPVTNVMDGFPSNVTCDRRPRPIMIAQASN